ncbi:hypothetical protein A7E75_02085 [Syntrophotalea acetylenica]|uniref:Uncharacterized protein n=1 Tax=Syntrophotalea acetylenica TaxID=29542 RepID=A0A1L3GDD2_SYNAC|nr:hypothetical protein A7E75_02085 [Syntrophotalea acetylenica]APG44527.1 hypothetical protein A6070_10705 [Syntrophotalea acetylenica]
MFKVIPNPTIPDPAEHLIPVWEKFVGLDSQFHSASYDMQGSLIVSGVQQTQFRDIELPVTAVVGTQNDLSSGSASRGVGLGKCGEKFHGPLILFHADCR